MISLALYAKLSSVDDVDDTKGLLTYKRMICIGYY